MRFRLRSTSSSVRLSAAAMVCALVGLVSPAIGQDAASTQAPAAPSKAGLPEVNIYLKTGERLTGLLVSADEKLVVVRIAGINTRLAADTIERYDVLPPILERYEELRKSIGSDPDDIVRLARWLQAREQYTLALTEVNRALEIDRVHADALQLKKVLEQLLVLKASPKSPKPGENRPSPEQANPGRRGSDEFPLLSSDDIGLIKVYEVDLASKPRLVIPREAVERMLAAHAGHPLVPTTQEGREAILRKSPVEILDLMFKLQARDSYRDVQVLDTPGPIRMFRDEVQRTWLMSCATSQCHGGLEAGRLVLHNRLLGSEASVYTNLLILSRFRTAIGDRPTGGNAGTDAAPGRPLIDWDHPERSPLLQVGLPREDSLFPHPAVPRPGGRAGHEGDLWRPAFRSTEDRMFKRTVEWIQSMYRPRPAYPVKYTPLRPFEPPKPVARPATPPGSGGSSIEHSDGGAAGTGAEPSVR